MGRPFAPLRCTDMCVFLSSLEGLTRKEAQVRLKVWSCLILRTNFAFHRHRHPAKCSSTRCWLSPLQRGGYSASAAILETQEAQTPSAYPSHELSISTVSYRSALPHRRNGAPGTDEVGLSSVSSVTIASRRCHHSRRRNHRRNRMLAGREQ